jgi:hypothetical protein
LPASGGVTVAPVDTDSASRRGSSANSFGVTSARTSPPSRFGANGAAAGAGGAGTYGAGGGTYGASPTAPTALPATVVSGSSGSFRAAAVEADSDVELHGATLAEYEEDLRRQQAAVVARLKAEQLEWESKRAQERLEARQAMRLRDEAEQRDWEEKERAAWTLAMSQRRAAMEEEWKR